MQDLYNKIAILYLGEDEDQFNDISNDAKKELNDEIAKKNFEKKIEEKFYDHQVNDKQELNKSDSRCVIARIFPPR